MGVGGLFEYFWQQGPLIGVQEYSSVLKVFTFDALTIRVWHDRHNVVVGGTNGRDHMG